MIVNKKDFCQYVEELHASNMQGMIDNVIAACEEYNIDPELVEPLINRSIREKLEVEFISLNYLKAQNHAVI